MLQKVALALVGNKLRFHEHKPHEQTRQMQWKTLLEEGVAIHGLHTDMVLALGKEDSQ